MKKHIKYLIPIFIIVMFLWVPNVFAAKNITIESATLTDKSASVSEISEPTLNGLNIGFDLSFSQVNDYAKYKVVINNPTSEDYEVSKSKEFISSDYLTYTYTFDGESNVVKAKEKLTIYITITYKTAVPSDKLTDRKYIETNAMTINLSNKTETITNPKTGDNLIIIISILLISIVLSLILYKTTKNKKYLNVMILSLILIPVGAYALKKLQVNVTTKITIEEKYAVTYSYWDILTEEEANTYESALTESEYDSEMSNRYYYVDGVKYQRYYVTKVDNYYGVGDSVVVIDQKSYDPYFNESICNVEWTGSDEEGWTCSSATLSTKKNILDYSSNYYWEYSNEDYTNLNFVGTGASFTDSYWTSDGNVSNIFVRLPKTFTMPSHEVSFSLLRRSPE